MATYIVRAVTLTEALKDAPLTLDEQRRVAQAFAKHYPQFFDPVDPANPTNTEYAQCLIDSQRAHFREILGTQAASTKRAELEAEIQAAADAAKADL